MAFVQTGMYEHQDVAIKKLKQTPDMARDFLKEASAMINLAHPRLVRLLGVVDDCQNGQKYLVMEYMKYGDLLSYLREDAGRTLQTIDLLRKSCQVNIFNM